MQKFVNKTSKEIKEKFADISEEHNTHKLDKAIEEAIRLSDLYADITPEQYIFPLDAMAGFPVQSKVK